MEEFDDLSQLVVHYEESEKIQEKLAKCQVCYHSFDEDDF